MPRPKTSLTLLALLTFALASTAFADSAHFKTVYRFKGLADGAHPLAMVMDSAGNLYGTTAAGGHINSNCDSQGCGTVFELSPSAGGWKKKTLYRFLGNADGATPTGQLVLDSAGNLYGVTSSGGLTCPFSSSSPGCGVVFELSPSAGSWTETTLYRFTGGADGSLPTGALAQDAAGNLIGGLAFQNSALPCNAGVFYCGQIFELSPSAGGWIESMVYAFSAPADIDSLMADKSGNIFGTTFWGGNFHLSCYPDQGCGSVFELSPTSGGWTFTDIFDLPSHSTGWFPVGALSEDPAGHLFGVTFAGGGTACFGNGCGTVYELTNSSLGWTRNVIHEFKQAVGGAPFAGLVEDAAGVLYGTTRNGSNTNCYGTGCGTVFKLTHTPGGGWHETVLHQFMEPTNGQSPLQLIIDNAGNLYGFTQYGGSTNCLDEGCGTVFEVLP